MAAQAAPNRNAKTTICSTSPRAMASMMLAGKTCSRMPRQRGLALRQRGFGGGALELHARAGPHQVHRGQPQEQRHRGDDLEVDDGLEADAAHAPSRRRAPAIPTTSVAKISGAMMDLISRRKMLLTGASCCADGGRAQAQRDAGGHADEDPGGERQPLHRSPHFSFWRSTSKNIMRGGRISRSACWSCGRPPGRRCCSGSPIWPSMVRIRRRPRRGTSTRIDAGVRARSPGGW